jgi:flagellar hook-associated protein 2
MSTSTIFSGSSRYSSDFQSIITRAVSIASLPKAQMENTLSALQSQQSALKSIDSKFEALQTAISSLASATAATNSSVSNASVAKATVSAGAMEGTYRVEVQDLGAYSLSLSADGLATVSDPQQQNVSASSSFTLTVDGVEYQITPESATLASLAAAVNASGAPVEATIVNVGSSSSPDYRLSLRSTALGAVPMQLNDGEADLLDSMSAGRKASYTLNGKTGETDSRTVTVGPGLELLLKAEGSTEITVSTSTSAISSALSSLATAYNAALSELDSHRGEDAGALKGSSLVYSLAAALRELAGYAAGSGDIDSLNGVGLTFQSDGKLSFDASTFEAAAANRSALAEFLGSASSGGFLKYATDLLDGLENDSSGLITENLSSLSTQISEQDSRIDAEQERVDALEEQLIARMAAADAAIAEMEQKVNYINGLFESMRIAAKSYSS